ncbi:MAG: hypothetical protein U5K79_17855 [Cyclobacteriaceae bacterium]|nr:hypothetical protein [Cyclobacteriaceae bacterium]
MVRFWGVLQDDELSINDVFVRPVITSLEKQFVPYNDKTIILGNPSNELDAFMTKKNFSSTII